MKSIGLVPELLVKDLKTSLNFYTKILGFEILYERSEEFFSYIKKDNVELMLEQIGVGRNFITGELETPFGRGINFQAEVSNVDELYKKLLEDRVEIFLPIEEKWYRKNNFEVGNRQFCVKDPDGYLFRFFKDLGQRSIN